MKVRTWLVFGAVLALGPRGYAQALGTNQIWPTAGVGSNTPFGSAILDHPGVKLPEQGPWTITFADLIMPQPFIYDLTDHDEPLFLFLWESLSSETRSALEEERAKMSEPVVYYKPGAGAQGLVANLNSLIQGKLIYDEKSFATIKRYLSGDTLKLLSQPNGTDVSRLNRLLLEDAFPLDIMRRPKILSDSANQNYVFVDFPSRTVSLYEKDGKKNWTADLNPLIAKEPHWLRAPGLPASNGNVGLWDVSFRPGQLVVRLIANHLYSFDLDTGALVPESKPRY